MIFRWFVIAAMGLGLAGCANFGSSPTMTESENDLSRQILVTARQPNFLAMGLTGDPATVYVRRPGYGPAVGLDRLFDRIARENGIARLDGWQIESLGIYCEVYRLAPGQDRDEILARLNSDTRIESAQAMQVYATEGVSYDDPYAPMQSALTLLSVDRVHEFATGHGVSVAVIDSMVDDKHPEIRRQVQQSRDLLRGSLRGGGAEIHGTAVAGVIASTANNAEGIVGIAPNASIDSLRACWTVERQSGRAMCSSFSIALALEVALRAGVDIINMSLSGPPDPLVGRLIDSALDRGVIVVAAMPDGHQGDTGFPASHPGVIAVGPRDSSATGTATLLAPASEILTTAPNADYAFFSGSSMSSAIVAGVVALLMEHRPSLNGDEAFGLLAATSNSDSINACRALVALGLPGALTGACDESVSELSAEISD